MYHDDKKERKKKIEMGPYFGFCVLGALDRALDVHPMAPSIVQLSQSHKVIYLTINELRVFAS